MTKEEFARRVEDLRSPMYRITCAYLRQEADRLDAVQEALLKAWKALPRLKDEQYFSTWITRILIRECVNIQRRQKRLLPMDTLPEPMREKDQSKNPELREAIDSLPQKQRIVIVLFYMEGCSVEEIMKILRLPKGTVCSRLNRARQNLKIMFKEAMDE